MNVHNLKKFEDVLKFKSVKLTKELYKLLNIPITIIGKNGKIRNKKLVEFEMELKDEDKLKEFNELLEKKKLESKETDNKRKLEIKDEKKSKKKKLESDPNGKKIIKVKVEGEEIENEMNVDELNKELNLKIKENEETKKKLILSEKKFNELKEKYELMYQDSVKIIKQFKELKKLNEKK